MPQDVLNLKEEEKKAAKPKPKPKAEPKVMLLKANAWPFEPTIFHTVGN
jgi:hypothetical protein